MTLQREPYVVSTILAKDVYELNDYLARELERIAHSMLSYEENLTVDVLEVTANASTASYLMLNCSATAIVITLPSANRVSGKRFTIKKTDGGANNGVIRAVGTDLIDGVASSTLSTQYQVINIVSDGDNWYVI